MEPPSSPKISILNSSGRILSTERIEEAARKAFELSVDRREVGGGSEVSILLTTDEEVQDLNLRFRGIDEPTDVLTFVDSEGSGDIAIAMPTAERQAELRGVTLTEELAYLAIHGVLHIAGLDDQEDVDRQAMQAEMNRIAQLVGLPADEHWTSLISHFEEVAG